MKRLNYRNIKNIYKASPTQEGMYFHFLSDKSSPVYFEQFGFRLKGELKIDLVKKSMEVLFKRYDILRTVFTHKKKTVPLQVVLQEQPVDFYFKDISKKSLPGGKEEFIRKYKEKERCRTFDLTKDILMRTAIIQLDNNEYEFIWCFHHIIMDGWCSRILLSEFFEIYKNFVENREYQLPPVKQYSEYIRWLEKQNKNKSKRYWEKYLTDYTEVVHIPWKKKGYSGRSGESRERVELLIDVKRTAVLNEIAGKYEVTMNTVFQGVWSIILSKLNNTQNVVFGTVVSVRPSEIADVENIVGLFINTIPLRVTYDDTTTFSELLKGIQNKAVESEPHNYYSLAEIQANSSLKQNPLDHFLLFENFPMSDLTQNEIKIHTGSGNKSTLQVSNFYDFERVNYDFIAAAFPGNERRGLRIIWEFNPDVYDTGLVKRISAIFDLVVNQIISNPQLVVQDSEMMSAEEKHRVLYEFNDTKSEYPGDKTIQELFEEQAEKTPGKTAISSNLDLTDIYDELNPDKKESYPVKKFEKCCFKKNPHVFIFENDDCLHSLGIFSREELEELTLLRTQRVNFVAVNKRLLVLLDCLTGETNLKSLFKGLKKEKWELWVYPIEKPGEDTDFICSKKEKIVVNESFSSMIRLIKILYHVNLIELSGYDSKQIDLMIPSYAASIIPGGKTVSPGTKEADAYTFEPQPTRQDKIKSPVLLLGDGTGQASTGLLYIASFLRRKGIKAYCRWNDINRTKILLKTDIEELLTKIQPKVVGVSMKWFPHIARSLEICRLVKEYDPSITIVVGGNTASYYKEKIIGYDCIDYVILGDGEVPFLKICRGEDNVPNCIYKNDGEIIETPITYVQDEKNSSEIYLSHLDEIFVSKKNPYLASYFYINTGKGCSMQCLYCAGCRDTQKRIFNRDKPFMRGVHEVRRDLIEAKKYAASFLFDFDLPADDSLEYYKKIWEGIDLSRYFCQFYFWKLPSSEFLDYVVKVFKYVCINIDICSLSEPHRLKLSSLGVVKPQPTDEELFSFFDQCEKYENVEVVINQITGLPYFSLEDIKKSDKTLSRLMSQYSTLKEMDWGRLHAQPGAPIIDNCEQYDMHCYARTYDEFLYYSKLNLEESIYPDIQDLHYPYIYSQDDTLNSKLSMFYVETNKKIEKHLYERRKGLKVVLNMTYKDLDEKATHLAWELKDIGVKPGNIVGIMVDRSVEMIVGMLGILKAGGAYLPMDTEYPPERIHYMLKDSMASIILTQSYFMSKFKSKNINGCLLDLFDDKYYTGDYTVESQGLKNSNTSTGLAYVSYTSGSTGNPKGVLVEHRNVARLVKNSNYIEYTEGDRLLLTGAFGFDITTFEIWSPLLNGVSLYLADKNILLDFESLKEIIVKNEITILHLIPQLFNQLVSQCPDIFAGLKYFLVGGDLVNPGFVNLLRSKYPYIKIVHMYGPTENTTFSTSYMVDRDYDVRIPIGKPISNSTVYILDKYEKPQLVGVSGELWVGGGGVARGYLNNVEFTNEKFRADPYMKDKRVYRTGDLSRWLGDGNLEFLGRTDNQVKIRGFRIELGEIEKCLLNIENIKDTVVIDKIDDNGNKYLCAYVVCDSYKGLDIRELRSILSGRLPDYMIPAYFVQLEQIPLTPNGKIDRKSLPEPEAKSVEECIPPGNEIEKKLAEIWEDVLDTPKIGINDNFFLLGGDSIKSIQIASQLNKVGYKVEVRDLFKHPTISELAPLVKHSHFITNQSIMIGEVPLTPIQKKFFIKDRVDMHHFNQDVMLYSEERLDEEIIKAIFSKLQEHHDGLRTTFKEVNGEIKQEIHGLEYPLSLEVYDFCGEANGDQLLESKANDIQSSIDLENGPLMKLGLFHLDDGTRLLIVVHHLVIDGISWRIIFEDIETLYQQYKKNEPLKLPLKTSSYKFWSENLSDYANSKRFLQEKAYWAELESTTIPGIVGDFYNEGCYVRDTQSVSFSLSEEETELLLTRANEAFGTEINDILVPALGLGVRDIYGLDKLLISLEGHGREKIIEDIDISRTVGWFTTEYPVILDFSYADDISRQIKEVKETLHEIPDKGIGYGILKYLTREENKRDISFKLEPQISFNYLGQFDEDVGKMTGFSIAKESTGDSISLNRQQEYDLSINGMILNKRLTLSITYGKQYKTETIQTLLDSYKTRLINIISFCSKKDEKELTPSDLDFKDFSIGELENFFN